MFKITTDMSLKLTVNVVRDHLISELKMVGFALTRGRPLKLTTKINDETEVFLYPGVFRRGPYVRIDPVIGGDTVRLRKRRDELRCLPTGRTT